MISLSVGGFDGVVLYGQNVMVSNKIQVSDRRPSDGQTPMRIKSNKILHSSFTIPIDSPMSCSPFKSVDVELSPEQLNYHPKEQHGDTRRKSKINESKPINGGPTEEKADQVL